METYALTLLEKKHIADFVYSFRFAKPDMFVFTAGQFVQFAVPSSDGSLALRAYSISSIPGDPYLEFCVKMIENGVASAHLLRMREGEEFLFTKAQGRFVMNDANKPLSAVATGAGLAPLLSIIRDQLETKKTNHEIRLLFGVRMEKDIFWTERLNDLQKTHPNFSYQLTVSRPGQSWEGLSGRVTSHLPTPGQDDLFYLCGNGEMIKDVRTILLQEGASAKAIKFEIF